MGSQAKSDTKRSSTSRRTASLTRTQVIINVYDLLPPSRLSTCLWHLGASCLHTGIVIGDKEYAYGGHDKKGVSGVYWTHPKQEPPGGYFRIAILQGFTFRTQEEIDSIVRSTSHEFLGPQWNLLKKNCNHFTSHLCEKLTGRPAPPWLNRAATIATALPCLVPRAWLVAPDADTADGELVDEQPSLDDIDEDDEDAGMLRNRQPDPIRDSVESSRSYEAISGATKKSADKYRKTHDADGRLIPVSERAPPPQG